MTANTTALKTKPSGVVEIHGREYETVALRVKKFREARPEWTLVTKIIERTPEVVIMAAEITDEAGRLRATGHAEEYRKSSQINRTSALENCETSAIGRALACLGLGGTEFASADEVANAIVQQKNKITPNAGAEENVTDEQKKKVSGIASSVIDCFEVGKEELGYEIIDQGKLSTEEKLYLWTFFDSKMRRRLKEISAVKHPFDPATGTYKE